MKKKKTLYDKMDYYTQVALEMRDMVEDAIELGKQVYLTIRQCWSLVLQIGALLQSLIPKLRKFVVKVKAIKPKK